MSVPHRNVDSGRRPYEFDRVGHTTMNEEGEY